MSYGDWDRKHLAEKALGILESIDGDLPELTDAISQVKRLIKSYNDSFMRWKYADMAMTLTQFMDEVEEKKD